MVMRLLLGAVTFGWIALFGLGLLRGDVGASGLVHLAIGLAFGAVIAFATRNVFLSERQVRVGARICFLLGLLFLAWGLVGLLIGHDPITREVYTGRGGLMAETLLMLSAAPAFAGFFLRAMRAA